jgi:deoxyribodipyrimidine photo-lyase
MIDIPEIRVRSVGPQQTAHRGGQFVLYWMTASRRTTWNFGLQRAVQWARDLRKPLVVLEALRCGYRWASDRLHQFVIQGMADNQARLASRHVVYYPYLEPEPGAGQGLLATLAQHACVVISDDFPCFFLPRMVESANRQIPTRFELVDSNGLLPMRAADRTFARAFDFRRFLQRNLRPHLEPDAMPEADPLRNCRLPVLDELPKDILRRWPAAKPTEIASQREHLGQFPIDHAVAPTTTAGGSEAAETTLQRFLKDRLPKYGESRNEPEVEATSGLSPYLHFGHVSVHQVFAQTMQQAGWTPDRISEKVTGSSNGWWGVEENTESFLDELITWREVGYNMCSRSADYDRYDSLPAWARQTLGKHADDPREYVYTLDEFEAAQTHDPLWNAAQRQLIREGRIHNYLRMVWGKKILEWSASPQAALDVLIELNNKYALDGRNPNSYSGIFWVLGRYDRAWGPERPIFGTIRYMSSENTARKVRVKDYVRRYTSG